MIALLCVLSLAVTTVHAEHKLFVTDVLDARQVEVEADFDYGYNRTYYARTVFGLFDGSAMSVPDTQTRDVLSSTYSLGVGLGYGLQLNAAIPFVFNDNITRQNNPPQREYAHDGLGDIAVGIKYSLYENRERSIAVVTGIDVKFPTEDRHKAGSGTTDVAPYLAASTVINQGLKPYAAYQAIFRNHGAEDSHKVTAGIEYEMNKTISLTPEFSAIFRTDSNWTRTYNSYVLGLSSYVNILSNFYLIPHVNGGINSYSGADNLNNRSDTLTFYNAGIALYYLFN